MNSIQRHLRRPHVISAALLLFALAPFAQASPKLVDDFSDAERTSTGASRVLVDDQQLGSKSHGIHTCEDGLIRVEGILVPGRGVPAFMSLVLLTAPDGQPRDMSEFEGIRLRVKVEAGTLSVQAGSSEIDNYDFHTSAIRPTADDFQEVRIPFKDMKRAWSEQVPLNLATLTSVNVVVFSVAKGEFAFELDEVGFY